MPAKTQYILIDNIQFIYGTNTNDINNPTIESVTETTLLRCSMTGRSRR